MNTEAIEQLLGLAEHYFRDNNHIFSKYLLEKILEIDLTNSRANELLAYIYRNSGQNDVYYELLSVACTKNDCSGEALYNFGSAQLERGLLKEAAETLKNSILKCGEFFEALHDLATAQAQMGDHNSALVNYQKCLKLNPLAHELYYNIARIFDDLNRHEEAIQYYDHAISLNSEFAATWFNKAGALWDLKRHNEAIDCYNKVLSLNPSYPEGWTNKAAALHEQKRFEEAITHYAKGLSLKPEIDWVYGELIYTKLKMCSWEDFSKQSDIIFKKVRLNQKVLPPFVSLALTDDFFLQKKSSEIYIKSKYSFNPVLGPILKGSQSYKIRIGYFSADFYNHATGYLMAELFELHNKSRFELIAFSFGPIIKDEMRNRLEKAFDRFIEVGKKSDVDVAKLSRDLDIHIAVDLKGFTQDSRTGIFAHRAAPIQVNYLGYPGSMGSDYIDYIIADKTLIPIEYQSGYSEKVAYLPNSYQVNDRKRTISGRQFTRQELGLPKNGFVFCCFNNNYKILPATFEGWMRILKAVEGSVLWLLQDNFWVVENLRKEAQKQRVEADRLIFAKRLPLPEHLARHCQADLFLDTFPYNAHTTASDALWTGLPVLTLTGESFASRVAASLLVTIGLPELITSTQEMYEALAIELALNPKKLAEIKLKLANNRITTPLFDTPLFTKNLEAAYIRMHEQYHSELEPEHFFIA